LLLPILLIVILQLITSILALKSQKFRKLIDGEPVFIIKDGKISQKELKKQRYSIDDLLLQLRDHNVDSLRNENLDNYKNLINNLSTTYGIVDFADSHMVTSLEWGATLYLSHSKYGVCQDDSCEMISSNDTYISEKNKQDTTTRNVYGVYDMAGGTSEYALGNNTFGSATYEVITGSGNTWYNGIYTNNSEYLIRGGINNGLFSTVSMDMIDVSTRSVLVSKEKDLVS
jgi:hypothetical protein